MNYPIVGMSRTLRTDSPSKAIAALGWPVGSKWVLSRIEVTYLDGSGYKVTPTFTMVEEQTMNHVLRISDFKDNLLAVVVKAEFDHDGIVFFSAKEMSQQLGWMRRPAGYKIAPHYHKFAWREVCLTQEVLFIKSGKVRMDLYGLDLCFTSSHILEAGDVVHLIAGGHGFEMLEESVIVEVKQGPYMDHDADKTVIKER